MAKSFKFADVENNMQIGKVYVAQGFCLKYRLKETGVNAWLFAISVLCLCGWTVKFIFTILEAWYNT